MSPKVGWSEAKAWSYINEFEGPITARISRPGEINLRYFNGPEGNGNFLTKSEFFSPVDAYRGLNLELSRSNFALSRQEVTTMERSIVFEGGIKDGGSGVRQILIPDKSNFQFGTGFRYY